MKTNKYSNLRPWQPGQSGNPAGRKLGSKNMSTIVKELLSQEADIEVLSKCDFAGLLRDASTTYSKAVVLATIHKALHGNMQAIAWLAEQQERGTFVGSAPTQEPLIISTIKARNESAVN